MDVDKTHELQHEKVSGIIPQARVQATMNYMADFGAAILIGGMS